MTAALVRDLGSASTLEEVARVYDAARGILPRSDLAGREPQAVPPVLEDGEWRFDNGFVRARVRESGALVELTTAHGRNVVAQANVLGATLGRWARKISRQGATLTDGALDVRLAVKDSGLLMRVALNENEPFLRVDLASHWNRRWTTLRSEHWLAVDARDVETNDRYARATASDGTGVAILTAEAQRWQTRKLRRGGVHFSTVLSDASFSFAYAPYEQAPPSAIERAWDAFVHPARVPLFDSDDEAIVVTTTLPVDGESVAVKVRESDGQPRRVRLRCAGRAKSVACEAGGEVSLDDGALAFAIEAHGTRSFVVGF
jgi:hypothetical protein